MPHTRTLPEKKKKCAGGDGQLYSKNGYSHLETAEKKAETANVGTKTD